MLSLFSLWVGFLFGFVVFLQTSLSDSVMLKVVLTYAGLAFAIQMRKIASIEFTSDVQCLSCACFGGDVCIKA